MLPGVGWCRLGKKWLHKDVFLNSEVYVYVCVCERERAMEREGVCVRECVYVGERVHVYV